MKAALRYLKYSGLWIGLVVNPWHWRWGLRGSDRIVDDRIFDNCLDLGPIWIRIIIDDGRW